jgi:hypothetical protein
MMRTVLNYVMRLAAASTDFELHTTAVGTCETRTRLSELLHKTLEKRFHRHVRRFAAARNAAALQDLWRECSASGSDLPGALWASWTHPSCDATLAEHIYADIHRIQHQVGCGTRADLVTLKALQAENARLRGQVIELRAESETQRSERLRETQGLAQQLAQLRADLAGKEGQVANVARQPAAKPARPQGAGIAGTSGERRRSAGDGTAGPGCRPRERG